MLETVRSVDPFGIDEARAARVVVRRSGQRQDEEAAEKRGRRAIAPVDHAAPSTRSRLPVEALCRIAIATRYPSEAYQALACS